MLVLKDTTLYHTAGARPAELQCSSFIVTSSSNKYHIVAQESKPGMGAAVV